MFIVGFSAEVSERLSLPFAVVRLTLFFVTMWKGLYGPPSAEEAGKSNVASSSAVTVVGARRQHWRCSSQKASVQL